MYICIQTHIHTHTYMCECMCVYACACVHMYLFIYSKNKLHMRCSLKSQLTLSLAGNCSGNAFGFYLEDTEFKQATD